MQTIGRQSGFTLGVPADMADQTTFMMSEPGGDGPATSPLPNVSATARAERGGGRGGDTYGNISFIRDDAASEGPPQFGDDDADDEDNRGGEVYDDDEPSIRQQQDESHIHRQEDEAEEENAEPGRRQSRPMLDMETFISDGEDSDPADATTRPHDASMMSQSAPARRGPKPKKKQKRISRHGAEYPPLPPTFVRRVAHRAVQTSGLSNHRISSDVLAALTQASEWFFEQLGDDLGAYADHAKRTVIEESDVMTLMKR